ncbi:MULTISPECIES: hypothetical protein [Paenibacillus]|nr:hypothetical protein [Paenibacillus odorifer]
MTNPMTPERIEEIKRDAQEEAITIYRNCTPNITNIELLGLLATLEESQQQKVELWECEDCGFAFPAMYEDDTPEGGHSCPVCAETRLEKELVEAQQTIARQHEQIKTQDKIITGHSRIIARYHDALFKISQDTTDERTAAFAWSVLE